MHIACCHMSWKPNYSTAYHAEACFKLCLLTGGSVLWDIEGVCYDAKEGDVVLLDDNAQRRFAKVHGPQPLSMQIIMFSADVLKDSKFLYLFYNTPLLKTRIVRARDIEGLPALLAEIDTECKNQSPYYRDIAQAKLLNALALIARHTDYKYEKPSKNTDKIREAQNYIDLNLTTPLTLPAIAQYAGMTASSFSKAFIKCVGISVTQYILRRRIEQSINLLVHTKRNVLDIALECGFNNSTAFYRAFRKITGKTPKEYRK